MCFILHYRVKLFIYHTTYRSHRYSAALRHLLLGGRIWFGYQSLDFAGGRLYWVRDGVLFWKVFLFTGRLLALVVPVFDDSTDSINSQTDSVFR